MAEKPRDAFNESAKRKLIAAAAVAVGIASVNAGSIHTQYETSLFLPNTIPLDPSRAANMDAPKTPVQRPLAVEEIWANRGLDNPKFKEAFAALSDGQKKSLAARSDDFFAQAGFTDVMLNMAEGKQKNLSDLIGKIADIPSGMRLRTSDYVSIEGAKNKDVWKEFQEKSEPLFYRHLVATQEPALREAGFCDHAIECMRRGHGPTNAEGLHYNVDIDHLVERKGGGEMSLKKSVDPLTGDAETFAVNHISNLCLIMRDVHEDTKNAINSLQNASNTPVGETRRIVMAVPEAGKERIMLQPENLRAERQPPADTAYFAMGPSALITRAIEDFKKDIVSPTEADAKEFFDNFIRDDFNHALRLWSLAADALEHSHAQGTLKSQDIKGTLKNCDENLKPLENILAEIKAPQDAIKSLA
ncbi:MAG: hypothetical protein RBS08_05140, partial [Bdellovibrionales bacterium]|nr:hypothetical protein [Bdellovibrionales bacterium]